MKFCTKESFDNNINPTVRTDRLYNNIIDWLLSFHFHLPMHFSIEDLLSFQFQYGIFDVFSGVSSLFFFFLKCQSFSDISGNIFDELLII